jgi:membrane protease subunit (stomatin/prohibitin family)
MAKMITYQGSLDALVWVMERKGLDSDTEVVVPVAHEAIFIKDGIITDSFTMGRHYLKECVVGEGHLFTRPDERVDCRIYYVKKEGTYNIKWETPAPICLEDPAIKKDVELVLGGVFAIKIINSKQFLTRLLAFTQDASLEEVKMFFRQRMLIYIKDQLLAIMVENKLSFSELEDKIMIISKELEFKLRYLFESFGVSIESFMLNKVEILGKKTKKDKKIEDQPAEEAETEKQTKGEVMYCPKCGVDLPPVSVFCFKCGAPIEEDTCK